MAIAEQILPAQQHLQAAVGERAPQLREALPRIFAQKAHASVEGRAAPDLERPKPGGVERAANRQHILGFHARGDERLVAVAQDEFGDADFAGGVFGGFFACFFHNRLRSGADGQGGGQREGEIFARARGRQIGQFRIRGDEAGVEAGFLEIVDFRESANNTARWF